jgi:hypothetical protein
MCDVIEINTLKMKKLPKAPPAYSGHIGSMAALSRAINICYFRGAVSR